MKNREVNTKKEKRCRNGESQEAEEEFRLSDLLLSFPFTLPFSFPSFPLFLSLFPLQWSHLFFVYTLAFLLAAFSSGVSTRLFFVGGSWDGSEGAAAFTMKKEKRRGR